MVKTIRPLIFISLIVAFSACNKNALYDNTASVPEAGWPFNEVLDFSFPVTDTSKVYDIYMHVRNEKSYSYSNLWLFIETTAPNGDRQRDTMEILLTNAAGQWLGKGTRSMNTMMVPFARAIKFPRLGVYHIAIQHAMRDTVLNDITDIGIRVEPTNYK